MIRITMTSEFSQQQNDAISYFTCSYISWHRELFFQTRLRGLFPPVFVSSGCYDRYPLSLSKICESVSEIFWNGDFMVRNTIITRQSALCSAVICRKRSTFKMRFHLMAVSIIFKTCVIMGIALADCLKGEGFGQSVLRRSYQRFC